VLGDLQSMCPRHDLFFFLLCFCILVLCALLPLFLVGFISSLPQLSWDKGLIVVIVVVIVVVVVVVVLVVVVLNKDQDSTSLVTYSCIHFSFP
jgi:hypothetical protein